MEEKLPPKSSFSEWYNELLQAAEIMDVRYPVKGLYVWNPFGFSLRNNVYRIMRELLDGSGHQEGLFPLLIPETEFMKEAEHIQGFEDEVYWVTHGGRDELEVKLALRPTSETAIYPMYQIWVRSHADLPLKIYQIVNTFRYETKHTRPLIRLREITSFKEAHTVHATWEEAAGQVEEAVEIYQEFYRRLAIPTVVTRRPDWDKFPGADYTLAVDALMPDGKTLQVGTAHHLGTNFAKTFDIKYEDPAGEQKYANQTCYGVSERSIAALISIHGDDRGLVLPPEVAPVQIVVIPIIFKGETEVMEKAREITKTLQKEWRVVLDDTDQRPGAKYYKWEIKGVPLRIEIGPRDLKKGQVTLVRRDTLEKRQTPQDTLTETLKEIMQEICRDMYQRAEEKLEWDIKYCQKLEDASAQIKIGIARIHWCGKEACGLEIEEITGANILGKPHRDSETDDGRCPICGGETRTTVLMAKTY